MTTDEFQFHTPESKTGILRLRAMSDKNLRKAMTVGSKPFNEMLDLLGPNTNHSWITAQAAEEAYRRDLIDEIELDRMMA